MLCLHSSTGALVDRALDSGATYNPYGRIMRTTAARVVAATISAVLTVVLTACGGTSAPADRQLVVGVSTSPSSLDPTTADGAAISQALLYNVYETLVKINDTGDIVPLLAKEWSVSPDGTSYTFELQPRATFASGAPVDSHAVIASLQRIIDDPAVLPILKKKMEPVSSMTAVDADTVQVQLNQPSNSWLFDIAERAGIIMDPNSHANAASQPQGSGPFRLDNWTQGDEIKLVRNSSYWGTGTKLAGITFRKYADPNAMNAAMLSGELDIISNVAAPEALSQFSDKRFTVLEGTSTGEIILAYNHASPALSNLQVRQAINYAIDRKALRDSVWAGKGELIGSMVAPTDPWYQDLSGEYPYDPAKARELLAASGITDLNLRLRIPTLPYAPGAASYITSQLAEVGITATVDQLEFPATWVQTVMVERNYDMTIISHTESRDIANFANPGYYWNYNNTAVQESIAAADVAPTTAERDQLMAQAAKLISDDAAADFLWLLPNLVVTTSDVTGVGANAVSLSFDMTAAAAPPK